VANRLESGSRAQRAAEGIHKTRAAARATRGAWLSTDAKSAPSLPARVRHQVRFPDEQGRGKARAPFVCPRPQHVVLLRSSCAPVEGAYQPLHPNAKTRFPSGPCTEGRGVRNEELASGALSPPSSQQSVSSSASHAVSHTSSTTGSMELMSPQRGGHGHLRQGALWHTEAGPPIVACHRAQADADKREIIHAAVAERINNTRRPQHLMK
jgi:hypothetical protein